MARTSWVWLGPVADAGAGGLEDIEGATAAVAATDLAALARRAVGLAPWRA